MPSTMLPLVVLHNIASISLTSASSLSKRAASEDIKFDTNYRSQFDIIWNCLSIIFASTWVTTHPNVLRYDATTWEVLRRRLKLMFIAVLSPEVTVSLSVKQWYGARRILDVFARDIAPVEEAKEAATSSAPPSSE